MSIACIRSLSRSCLAPVAISAVLGGLYFWTAGSATDAGRAEMAPASVLVSVSLLDMNQLAPAQFGDWEPAILQTK